MPNGKLILSHNSSRCKWYVSDGAHTSYIPKSQRIIAEQLAEKKYLSCILKDLLHEQNAIQFYLSHRAKDSNHVSQLLSDPFYQDLLNPFFKPPLSDISEWQNSPFEHNTNYPEQLIHTSFSGNILRSKSESLIDMGLYLHKIPFRYECALYLSDAPIYPDFTILHPQTHQVYYWEHFE